MWKPPLYIEIFQAHIHLVETKHQELHPNLPHGWQVPNHVDYILLPSQVTSRGAGLEI